MSALDVEIEGRAGSFAIEAAFSAGSGITALFGPSGAGKTTILKMIAGMVRPHSGRIVADGRTLFDSAAGIDLSPPARRVGFVFQDGRLFPHLSVRSNLTYARWAGRRRAVRPLDEVVALLGLEAHLERLPATLSGGERQRVAIGRALLSDPALLLMDEPLSSLDRARRAEILPYLEMIRAQTRIPILYVSHETGEVARLADTVVLVDGGRVSAVGAAATVLGAYGFAHGLDESEASALIEGRVVETDADYATATVTVDGGRIELTGQGFPVGSRLRLRVRASDVAIATAPHDGLSIRNQIPCAVEDIRSEGAYAIVALALGGQRLLARITRKSATMLALAPGMRVIALLKAVSVDSARMDNEGTVR